MTINTMHSILVPVDFGPHSDRAVSYATRLAADTGASIELLHVVEDPYLAGVWTPELYLPDPVELCAELAEEAQDRLAIMTAAVRAQGVTASAVVRQGAATRTIVDYASAGRFDLIVLGTHGRTGLTHALLGSVAEHVLRRAPCPVLTVKAAPVRQSTGVASISTAA
jgi:nucleotide-binding universal stress UspA family protein